MHKWPEPNNSSTRCNVLAHLEKISTLLSIYDALQMYQELRESLIQVLSTPQEY